MDSEWRLIVAGTWEHKMIPMDCASVDPQGVLTAHPAAFRDRAVLRRGMAGLQL